MTKKVHMEIKPLKAYVSEYVLYDGEEGKRNAVPCTIFGVSMYKGESPTFMIMLDEGSVFSYVPPHMISLNGEFKYDLKDIVYHNVPSYVFSFHFFRFLDKKTIRCFLKNKGKWVKGKYLGTFDWYKGNDLLHMVVLENSQIGFLPSHKIKFQGKKKFLPFKKMHFEWKV